MIINKELKYTITSENSQYIQNLRLKVHNNSIHGMFVVHRAAIKQLNNSRLFNAHTKTRSSVKGGGRKPWKQKGTGKARAGSNRSPLWRGGGVIFGPKNIKRYQKINKKEKQLAIRTLLVNKLKLTHIVHDLGSYLIKPSTKVLVNYFQKLGISINREKLVVIVCSKEKNLMLSARNLKNVELILVDHMNVISLLHANKIIITQNGLHEIAKLYK